ncbi:TIGR01777 family protein [Pedobacter sp. HMF7647]|uniref:TIGR01777 family protein n=1 Tax=Hufsiella arboris TaxID=2695275 RepID=A0A7K1YEW6_9SPHI|nr:TIGR01777 family oxidoreductase [Hufsiella arboris]MXV52950.1 TIGR01777 family protein [Hufsiella arboris]
MQKRILLTDGTGLIGKHLVNTLRQQDYVIYQLLRDPAKTESSVYIKNFKWDVKKGQIDPECIHGVSAIIHLAGEPIAGKRWTHRQKMEIVSSRTESIRLVYELLNKTTHQVDTVISASAVGYYGNRGDELLTEDKPPGRGFLADTCIEWEKAVDEAQDLKMRVVKLRTGIVLSKDGGALPQLAKPIRTGLGAALGSGRQWMPWIHLNDVIQAYTYALNNENVSGTFNLSAPAPVTNKEFTETLAELLHKKIWLPNLPEFSLKLILGEMSETILDSNRTACQKLTDTGFKFQFSDLRQAISNIYA